MIKPTRRITRGFGLLEIFLSSQRAKKARRLLLLKSAHSLLDIGCGFTPAFLLSVACPCKVGIDRHPWQGLDADMRHSLRLVRSDAGIGLPFGSSTFDRVTALAIVEHLVMTKAQSMTAEVYRVLRPGGVFVLTTPTRWSRPILETLARFYFVSPEEVGEHATYFSQESLLNMLTGAGFDRQRVRVGTFEAGLNLWAQAVK